MRFAAGFSVSCAAAVTVVAPIRLAGAWTQPPPELDGDLVVFAAASLTDAFTAIGEAFESEHPEVDITFNFAASSGLVTQIREGAPADVVATADRPTMGELVADGLTAAEPATFATNSLAIVVEPGNPEAIDGIEDLTDPDLIVVTCDPAVPIGRYTQDVVAAAGAEVTPDSFEENVRGIVTKVVEGEADAGVVYVTDIIAAGADVEGVEIPPEHNVLADYPIAVVADPPNPAAAAAFRETVLAPEGQAVLAGFGFGPIGAPAATVPEATAT